MALPGKEEPVYLTAVVPYIRPCKEEGMYITGFFRPVPLARLSLPFMCHFITVSLSLLPLLFYILQLQSTFDECEMASLLLSTFVVTALALVALSQPAALQQSS